MLRRLSTMERGMVVALLAIAVLMIYLSRNPGTPEPQPPGRAELTKADVGLIAKRVERLRGLRFKRPVEPLFLNRDAAVELEEEANRRDYPEVRRRADEHALKLLGLLKPSDDLGEIYSAIESEQVLGFYDPKTKRMVVIRSPGASRALLEVTLAHELTHALEDQHFGLDDGSKRSPNDDASVAFSAMAEGSATEVMTQYAGRFLSAGGMLSLIASDTGDFEFPEYVEHALLFPYEQGQKFVQTFMGQREAGVGGSWGAFDSLMKGRRAQSSEQILHPLRFALDDRPRAVAMPDVAQALAGDWARTSGATVGEFDLRELFATVGGHTDAEAAEGWGGGRFELWRRRGVEDCDAPCTRDEVGVLRIAWDTPSDQAQGQAALKRTIERGLQGKRLGGSSSVGLWSSRGGAIGMLGSDRTTTVVFAPEAANVARLLKGDVS